MLVTNIPSEQIPRDIKCAKPCILVNLAKDNYHSRNGDDSETWDPALRRMTFTFGFCVCCSPRKRSSTQMEEKHQPHLCIKTETGHKGVISRLQIIVPPFFIMLMLSSDSKRFPSGLLSLGFYFGRFLFPSPRFAALLVCFVMVHRGTTLYPHPFLSNLDKVHNFYPRPVSVYISLSTD